MTFMNFITLSLLCSNVLEKCLVNGSHTEVAEIIDEILQKDR